MAHPDRAEQVAELLDHLGRPVRVHYDTEGPASGNADRVWRTARGGWLMHDPDADYHLLLQDDAVVCQHLLTGLEVALEHVPPGAVVSPYLGRGGATPHRWRTMAADANRLGASWVVSSKLMWGVGIALPVSRIAEMIDMVDRWVHVTDDMRVAGWAEKTRTEVWYTWPSLIDHRPVPSLTKHHAKERRAERHHMASALDLDWRGPVVRDPMLVRSRRHTSGPTANRKVTSLERTAGTGEVGTRA
jgi:hypothetical protein